MTNRPVGGAPMFNAPRVVTALIGALVLVHAARLLLGPQADEWVLLSLSVVPARYLPGPGNGLHVPGGFHAPILTLVTYTFLHGSVLHLLVNSIWLLALGSGVARRMKAGRFLAFYFLCGALAALAYIAVNPGSTTPMIGASGAISGLMGGAVRFLAPAGRTQGSGFDGGQLASILDRRVVVLVILWFALNFLFGQGGFSALTGGHPVAWQAHVGGFVAGLLLFGLFDRRGP